MRILYKMNKNPIKPLVKMAPATMAPATMAPAEPVSTSTKIKNGVMGMFNWMKSKMPYTKKGGRSSKRTRKNRRRGGYVIHRNKSISRKGKP